MSKDDILLIYPSYSYPRKSPPLGLAYLSAYLKQNGFKTCINDLNVSGLTDSALKDLLFSRPWLLICISFMTNQFSQASRLAAFIKRHLPDTILVAGGPHPSSTPERTLDEIPSLDIIIKGEGEQTLTELSAALKNGRNYDKIRGLCYRKNGRIFSNEKREFIPDLDVIPFPDWGSLDIHKYNIFNLGPGMAKAPVFAVLSSRGCPNQCIFCDSHTIFDRKFRARSAVNIYKEILYLNKTYGMLEFDFVDDLITMQKGRVLEFCRLIKGSGIPFRWMANSRVNTVDLEMLSAMKDAGCVRVDFGVETGDPRVRELMKKNITDGQIRAAHLTARSLGLSTGTFTMVGNLGETKESAKMTVELLKDIGDDVMVSIACPFPGTELFGIAKEKGLINTQEWSRYVTSPTYTSNYRPVMRTENLSEEEILDAFYYIHSFFTFRKFKRRFGRYFFLDPRFYKELIFKQGAVKQRFKMARKLISSYIKRVFLKK